WFDAGANALAMIPILGQGTKGAQLAYKGGKLARATGKLEDAASVGMVAKKAMNLPAWKKVTINMEHILSGHAIGGSRVSSLKTLFPSNWTSQQIENAIRQAYRRCKRIRTQGDRVLVRGEYGGKTIEMWINTVTKRIETAYPL
ncbi:hypothetical protein LCGC14_2399920, partial [marine sediment metagenome]